MKSKRGIMTIFVCLILTAVLLFSCTVIEAVRITGARIQAQAVSDSAVDSLLSEYDRPLLEAYHLFFFDGARGQTAFSAQAVTAHMQEYMEKNLHPSDTLASLGSLDAWQLTTGETSLTACVLATDDACSAYRRQAADSVKTLVGESLLSQLTDLLTDPTDLDALEESYETRTSESEEEIKKQEQAAAQEAQEEQDAQGETQDGENPQQDIWEQTTARTDYNPIEIIKQLKEKGILAFVAEDPAALSDKEIQTDDCVSKRTLQTGISSADETAYEDTETLTQKALFYEYLMRKFSSAVSENKASLANGTALSYELEYLIEGKGSDTENLKGVVYKLLLVREAANFAYLLTDASKQVQAETLAVAITGAIGIAPLASAVKYGILLAWAYAESIVDVRSLLSGGSVAAVKTAQTWTLALENIGALADGTDKETTTQEGGLSYETYLRLLLFSQDEETLALRSLDLIEKNMRLVPGEENFSADALVESLTAETTFTISPLFLSAGFAAAYQTAFSCTVQSAQGY